eukprot:GGOE01043059.1.p1 GENE.GGOE01043059.1~~GGOE01043059.1.p1  ORF type:complete len:257 (-),score=69.89 GGOE01043059.1:342-1112(-)
MGKKRKRSSSSSSSPSSSASSAPVAPKSHKKHRHKEHKKEKKSSRKSHRRKSSHAMDGAEEERQERRRQKVAERTVKRDEVLSALQQEMAARPAGQRPPSFLSMSDMLAKNAEMTTFCHEQTGKHFRELDAKWAAGLFFEFAKLWNTGRLPPKYYAGIQSTQLEPSSRTSYKWSFTEQLDPLELASARDAVDTDTNSKNFYDLPKEFRKRREGQEETPREKERRERQEQWERAREEEDPFEQRRRWEAQAKLKPGH